MRTDHLALLLAACMATCVAAADAPLDSPGGAPIVTGRISEWPIPNHRSARDPAIDSQGHVYFAQARGDRITRFDPRTQRFSDWKVPEGTQPQGVVATGDGKVLFGGSGNGTIGELDPATGAVRFFHASSATDRIYSLTEDSRGNIWFTERNGGRIGMLDRPSGAVTHWTMDGEPYGLAQGRSERIWVTRIAVDKVSVLNSRTGEIRDIFMGQGSKPRRIAVAPNGMVWVTLYGSGKLAMIDPATHRIRKVHELPGGPNSGPYSVAVDSAGRVWVSLFQTDSIAVLDPVTGKFQAFTLADKRSGIRNAALDGKGRFWFIESTSGKLGMIE